MRFRNEYRLGPLPASCFDDREFWTDCWLRSVRNDGFEPQGYCSAELALDLIAEPGPDGKHPEAVFVTGPVRRAR